MTTNPSSPILIPLEPGGKRPYTRNWQTLTKDQLQQVWDNAAARDSNVGIRLDGLVVIDCDNEEMVKLWRRRGVPTEIQVQTPKGVHFY